MRYYLAMICACEISIKMDVSHYIGMHDYNLYFSFPTVCAGYLALLKAQICMISFQTCTQIFGIHKALIHFKR